MAELNKDPSELKQCSKCGMTLVRSKNYYRSNNKEKYTDDGYLDKCKKCFTMHVNVYEPASFLPLLEEIDVPYIETEWQALVDKYAGNSSPTAVFGRYISKMKLNEFSKYRFKDTDNFVAKEKIRKLKDRANKLEQVNKYREAITSGKIAQALQKETGIDLAAFDNPQELLMSPEELFTFDDSLSIEQRLTKEDKEYLTKKWGKTYNIKECVALEKLYVEMMEAYDIRTPSHIDYLLKICRISLKSDQALEVNDIDGFQKLLRVYDTLMKSAKFTAVQNKDDEQEITNSVGVLVSRIEKEKKFIPEYVSERQDIVDKTLEDMNNYTRELVMSELNLGSMIEGYLLKLEAEMKKEDEVLTTRDEDDDGDDILDIDDL